MDPESPLARRFRELREEVFPLQRRPHRLDGHVIPEHGLTTVFWPTQVADDNAVRRVGRPATVVYPAREVPLHGKLGPSIITPELRLLILRTLARCVAVWSIPDGDSIREVRQSIEITWERPLRAHVPPRFHCVCPSCGTPDRRKLYLIGPMDGLVCSACCPYSQRDETGMVTPVQSRYQRAETLLRRLGGNVFTPPELFSPRLVPRWHEHQREFVYVLADIYRMVEENRMRKLIATLAKR